MEKSECYGYVKCGDKLECKGCINTHDIDFTILKFEYNEPEKETKICCNDESETECNNVNPENGLMECVLKSECCEIEDEDTAAEERSLLLDEIKSGLDDIVKLQNYKSNDHDESDAIEENNVIKVLYLLSIIIIKQGLILSESDLLKVCKQASYNLASILERSPALVGKLFKYLWFPFDIHK